MHTQQRWVSLLAVGGINILCLGLTLLGSMLIHSWKLMFALLLIGQMLFFMAVCVLLAQQTPLVPNHRSYLNTPPTVIIARMEQLRRQILAVDLIGGGVALSIGIALIIVAALASGYGQFMLTAVPVLLAFGCALFAHSATLVAYKPAHAYLGHAGVPATARVLSVTNMRRIQHSPTYDRARWYRLELEVIPAQGAAYPVVIEQLIRQHPSNMPIPGTIIPIRHLPLHPELVVALLNPEDKRLHQL